MILPSHFCEFFFYFSYFLVFQNSVRPNISSHAVIAIAGATSAKSAFLWGEKEKLKEMQECKPGYGLVFYPQLVASHGPGCGVILDKECYALKECGDVIYSYTALRVHSTPT